MTEVSQDADAPPSVVQLWHEAQISHWSIPTPAELLSATRDPGSPARIGLGIAVQETTEHELIGLLIDEVLDGRGLHQLPRDLRDDGLMQCDDLVSWSEMFSHTENVKKRNEYDNARR